MDQLTGAFRPGDLVEVKSADEILATLDADGTLDHLPFMPEMVEFCGAKRGSIGSPRPPARRQCRAPMGVRDYVSGSRP